jgi:hypothetical protein
VRSDAIGFWWQDEPVVKTAKAPPPKRTPPDPVWLKPDYLPGLQEALAFNVHIMDDNELLAAQRAGHRMVFDVEVYRNYFLIAFTSLETGHVAYFEMAPGYPLDIVRVGWILTHFTMVGFNTYNFDIPIVSMALAGKSCEQLKEATNKIIYEEWRPQEVLKHYKVKSLLKSMDSIDLVEVAPLQASLKIYGGRLHAPRMQDLPFHHEATLSPEQMAIVRWYCVNDLTQTAFLHEALKEQISLRETLGREMGLDLRSKSDAQIAEAVIAEEIWKLNRERPTKPTIPVGTAYRYQVPHFIRYETPLMNWALSVVADAQFIVAEHGSIEMPKQVGDLQLRIADNVYRMGIGGLHSSERRVAYRADANTVIVDRDVTSYYPQIILNLGLYPRHLGPNFIRAYSPIVQRRVHAKERGDKVQADSLKIVVNGSFGKLGSKYSILYSPDLLIQVTITGQLALLMLIECLELRGFTVISANTDGVVIRSDRARRGELEALVKQWEQQTGFATEETEYSSYYARDVNNYIAVKVPDKEGKVGVKSKGAYANPWSDPKQAIFRLHKNPTSTVCLDAVEALLTKNVAVNHTIRECKDIRKFVCVRKVKGGAVKDGEYLGSSIRWYYSLDNTSEMVYASSGNKVPRSDGAKPLMVLPEELPGDIDYEWYEREADKILREISYLEP